MFITVNVVPTFSHFLYLTVNSHLKRVLTTITFLLQILSCKMNQE